MKTIAFYLPQFHEIEENNQWWGKGFTEWVNLKQAKPLFDGHYQPRVPLDKNYYDLTDINVMQWQVKLAREFGVYGFCFYHYWFNGHILLEKPIEQYLKNKELDLPFCICWANEHWTKAWASKNNDVLIEQHYGGEQDWEQHFEFLLPFLKDERYIRVNGKPLLIIYRPEIIQCLNEMLDYWNDLAVKNGLEGIVYAYQQFQFEADLHADRSRFFYNIEYQPIYAFRDNLPALFKWSLYIKKKIEAKFDKSGLYIKKIKLSEKPEIYDYDKIWGNVLNRKPLDETCIPGAFVDWDNTPRRGSRGKVVRGATPEKFKQYLKKQIIRTKEIYKKDMFFMFAWNEWSEAGYLEPDEKYGHGYLKALKEALKETNEFPV